MIKVLLNGCNGVMGKAITECCKQSEDIQIIAGVDINTDKKYDYPVFSSYDDITEKPDVIVDFSNPKALNGILDYSIKNNVATVIATTGFSDEQIEQIKDASKQIPLLFSANMSIGVNLLSVLVKQTAKALGLDYNIEVVEAHHNKKLDAPSGTALLLADSAKDGLECNVKYEYNRNAKREKRPVEEIGIHSIRGGTIVGEHQVMFIGDDEIITLSHSARSKKVLALGVLTASRFIVSQQAGLYSMLDALNIKF